MTPNSSCPVCKIPVSVSLLPNGRCRVECYRCTPYQITGKAELILRRVDERQCASLSGYLSENPGFILSESELESLKNISAPSLPVKAEKILAFLAKQYPTPGEKIQVHRAAMDDPLRFFSQGGNFQRELTTQFRIVSAGWSLNGTETEWLVDEFLTDRMAFLTRISPNIYRISSKGWEFLAGGGNPNSNSAFVAMSFDLNLTDFYVNGLSSGIRAAGFEPLRVDKHEHVNRIDDEIIASLKRSRFCVADFSHHKNGVYFEAGFALGHGLPVIWTCAETDLKNAHFDTRQFNTLKWEADKLPDFAKRLTNRILAVVGKGRNSVE